jgi:DNA anti-recombination protein RmuC
MPVPYQKKETNGKSTSLFNPKVGEYEVAVTIGPSFATKRAEAADSMVNFLKVLPNTAPMVADLVAKNMDWPGSEEIAERLASQLPPNLLQKDTSDFPPQAKALIQSLNSQLQKLGQEHQQALAMLGDKEADREIEKDKINKDFEAKLSKVVADYEAKVAGMAQDNFTKITKMVEDMQQQFELQNVQNEADQKVRDAEQKAEQAKQQASQAPQQARQGDIGKLADMAKQMADSHKEMGDTVKTVLQTLSKPKKGKIKGPSGKIYELSTE